ncbi:MAG: hypothetical protein HQ515_23415 [Phycisphaeraceae bacterium]|nr:hypothetical protein [Phycisphaeraceae bacterium]
MDSMVKKIVCLCILGLIVGVGGGCRRSSGSGSRNFSQDFDSERKEDLATAAKMYDSVCQELESRNFKEVKLTVSPEMKSSLYEGEYDGFPLTVEIRYLLDISEENPEFHYRVSFQKTTAVTELNKASKDLRVLMSGWWEI